MPQLPARLTSSFLTLAMASLAGCAQSPDLDDGEWELDANPGSAALGAVDAPAGESLPANLDSPACTGPGRPVIVKTTDGNCPDLLPDWDTSNLFVDGSPTVATLALPPPASMTSYCRYSYKGLSSRYTTSRAQLDLEIGSAPNLDAATASNDCRAFDAEGLPDPEAAAVVESLHDSLMANIDALDGAELGSLGLSPIELRVVDSIHESALLPNDTLPPHGLRLEGIISDIACADDHACGGQIQQVLALPRRPWTDAHSYDVANWETGGHTGYWSDLALGIYTAVQAWRAQSLTWPGHHRLVVNLSLGGVPETAIEDAGPEQSVIAALTMAACYGAIVVASAGNRSDLSCESETGMLAPAVFEAIPRPSASDCAALGFVPDWDTSAYPVHDPGPTQHPLLWAIAGVDGHDQPIANGRASSFSRIVAAGANGVASGQLPYTMPVDEVVMTGTSVSAAVTSATAMTVWGYDPSLRPDEVMAWIYAGGHDIGEQAVGFYAGEPVHRLSVCGALSAAGATLPGCVVGPPDANANLDGYVAAMDTYVTGAVEQGEAIEIENPEPIDESPDCGVPELFPGVGPQPEKPICSLCGIEVNDPDEGKESLQMTMAWTGQGPASFINSGIIHLEDTLGQPATLTLDQETLDAINLDPPATIVKMYFDYPNVDSAVLELNYDNGDEEKSVLRIF